MRLLQLKADNYRLFQDLSLLPHSRLNFFYGANAAGKTSLLEAIYTLGRAKSFRGSSPADLAGTQGKHWTLFGRVSEGAAANAVGHRLGVGWANSETTIRIDNQAANSLELLKQLSVQVLEPGMHRVLQDGPTYRRSFLDWGVFHVEHQFMPIWRRYKRALRQRNQALRNNAGDRDLAAWEPELAEAGEALTALREHHLGQIQNRCVHYVAELLSEGDWSFDLHPGWPRGSSLKESLIKNRGNDRRMGLTQVGPHRAELRIRADSHAIKYRISRGQQKLLIAAMLLAQSEEIGQITGQHPLLLVDDFGAELADQYQQALLNALQRYPGQVFVTAFEKMPVLATITDASMFHVERGVLRSI
ncbi:MAG: DNA replication/repair protein RecF [Pseudomonadota bacterium]|nr:DNA replication/repair protein RecF [Pseudomonadota bacterium]